MSQENKALTQRWFEEVWNKGRAEAIDEMLVDNVIVHGLADTSGGEVSNIGEFHQFHTAFRSAFPGIQVTVEDLIAEGDKVTARCRVRGTHEGNLAEIGATKNPIDFTGIAIVRIEDGKIVEAWNNFDFLKMNQQLGLM